jgi:glycosyltransferase involved in cell wall biosynthesis
MTSNPRVSVLLPVYNAAQYLQSAVESILAQTMPDFELIAFDDGSTDESRAILDRMAERDPRIRVFSRPNKGLIGTLNDAIAVARAPILARMDHDDISLPDRFARQLARLEAEPDLVAVSGNCLMTDPESRPLMTNDLPPDHETIDANHLQMPPNCSMAHPALMMRREAVERIGGYHEDYPSADDVDLYLRLAEIGRLANLEEVVLHYRLHPGSIGHTRRFEQVESSIRAMRDARARRGLPPHPDPGDAAAIAERDDGEDLSLRWGWWALKGGHVASARHYAGKALREAPFDMSRWALAACVLRDSLRPAQPQAPRPGQHPT